MKASFNNFFNLPLFHRESPPLLRLCFGLAIIALILGLGNLIFGHIKALQYADLMRQATQELKVELKIQPSPEVGEPVEEPANTGLFPYPALNVSTQARHIERIGQRLEFYNFVALGGKGFLALAGLLLLLVWVQLKDKSREEGE